MQVGLTYADNYKYNGSMLNVITLLGENKMTIALAFTMFAPMTGLFFIVFNDALQAIAGK